MIVKVKKKQCPYAQISNAVLNDKRLSFKALGVLAYLLSKPDDWKVSTADLMGRGQEQRDALRAAFKELRDCGYAQLVAIAGGGSEWIIRETENPTLGETGFPSPENPTVGKPAPTNKVKRQTKDRQTPAADADGSGFLLNEAEVNGAKPIVAFSETFRRISAIFHRKLSTQWSDKERKAFSKICPIDDDELTMVERYYSSESKRKDNICRRDLYTFLNNYRGEVDRARAWCEKNPLRGTRTIRTMPKPVEMSEEQFNRSREVARDAMEKFRKQFRHEE